MTKTMQEVIEESIANAGEHPAELLKKRMQENLQTTMTEEDVKELAKKMVK